MTGRPWWNLEPHGTLAAFRRHERAKEAPCPACREVHNEDSKYRMRATRARREKEAAREQAA